MMLPQAHICHRTPERLRVKIPSKKGDESYFYSLSLHLSKLHGIKSLNANPITGSVLLVSAGYIDREGLATYAETNQLFRLDPASPGTGTLSERVVNSFNNLDDGVRSVTGGEIDIAGMAFLGLVGAGLYQLSIGNFAAPAWYTAFWYATSILFKSHAEKTRSGLM